MKNPTQFGERKSYVVIFHRMNDKQMMCELNVGISVDGIVYVNLFDMTDGFDGF